MKEELSINELLFIAASNLPGDEERQAFLEFACRGDDARLKRLEQLFEVQPSADDFFEFEPAVSLPETLNEEGDGGLGAQIGPYRLIDRLGAGGCGIVYLAEQMEPVKRKVALKIIRLGMDSENVIARFKLEREALALMDHPHIARVLDAGATASGRPYFVMDLVEGEPITEFCRSAGLDLRQRAELFARACQAIQHAHQKGVIHRDIKPSNVLVRWHDGVPEPKIIDFGIAKAAAGGAGEDGTLSGAGQLVGTPAYMSPEQANGGADIDTRSDIYSLGALLYELIAGRAPFDSNRLKEVGNDEMRRILREEEPPLPNLVTGTGKVGDLDWIVAKAMAKERQRRYDTANGLAVDVMRYLNDEPINARPPSRSYRLGKLVRRNKVVFVAGAISVFALVAGFGVSTKLFFREKATSTQLVDLNRITETARINERLLRENAEYREKIAHAAVQLGRGNEEAADQLLSDIPLERIPLSLETADCFRKVAKWHMVAARLEPAANRYFAAALALSNIDDSDSEVISLDLLAAGTALCYAGNDKSYEHFRSLALQRFSNTRHPAVAEQMVKALLLRPAPPELLRQLDGMVVVIEKDLNDPAGKGVRNRRFGAWSLFSLALRQFREGNDEEAVRLFNQCLAYRDSLQGRTAAVKFTLAMIEGHRANWTKAYELIEVSRNEVDAAMNPEQFSKLVAEGNWLDWVLAKLLLDEARRSLRL